MTTYAHIVGWGKYIPETVVTNDDLAKLIDTSDEWIRSRTGISERRFAAKDESTASMAIIAAQRALDEARIAPSTVDMIIVATFSPEHLFPSTACLVQDAIGATHAGAFDLSAACAGFVYALSMGSAVIQAGQAKVVLVIGSETVSRLLDTHDRTTYPLFGDGAGAVVLQAHDTPGVLATVLGPMAPGRNTSRFRRGSKLPASHETVDQHLHAIRMNGREVYRFATRVMSSATKQACEKAGVALDEVNLLIPHQANMRIIESASKNLKIGEEKIFTNLDRYGNTSAASIPIALCEAIEAGRVQNKDKLVMVGFGGGLTWGATVVQWGVPMPYKQRGWWYKGLRWTLYRWARVRSTWIRLTRWFENLLPVEDKADGYLTPSREKPKEEKSKDKSSTKAAEKSALPEEKPKGKSKLAEKPALPEEKPKKKSASKVTEKPALPEEKLSEEKSKENAPGGSHNGHTVKPISVEIPGDAPPLKPAEFEEKVLEIEKPLNGK
ncbi:MAG: beta-ketoacyl-ACP synthase 3 [Anaerolineae bacterium]